MGPHVEAGAVPMSYITFTFESYHPQDNRDSKIVPTYCNVAKYVQPESAVSAICNQSNAIPMGRQVKSKKPSIHTHCLQI